MNIGQDTTTLRRLRTVGNCLHHRLFVSRRWTAGSLFICIHGWSHYQGKPAKTWELQENPKVEMQGGITEGTQLKHAWTREASPADGGRRLGIRIFREIAARGTRKWLNRTAAMPGQEFWQACLKSITTAFKLFEPPLKSILDF